MINAFSKLNEQEKVELLQKLVPDQDIQSILKKSLLTDEKISDLIKGFSENVISTFPFPYAVAPNFLIDGKEFIVPMVTEESSVVAAAAKSAKYWYNRGGFHTEIPGTLKKGHVHFIWKGSKEVLSRKFSIWKTILIDSLADVNAKMAKRGGGLNDLILLDRTDQIPGLIQLEAYFDTQNAMGANYINTCLERLADVLENLIVQDIETNSDDFERIMSILSNYSPEQTVKVFVECQVEDLVDDKLPYTGEEFANRFKKAVDIACVDTNRSVTHNKGIFNGIDAVVLATGNDWRAIEANAHAFAARNGFYQSLSNVIITNNVFRLEMEAPMQLGVVGGVTSIHPLAKLSLAILGNPSATELMRIIASVGLASNFSAVKSLVTTGIQKGHMAMHLSNVLTSLNASIKEIEQAGIWFADKTVSYSAVEEFLQTIRKKN